VEKKEMVKILAVLCRTVVLMYWILIHGNLEAAYVHKESCFVLVWLPEEVPLWTETCTNIQFDIKI
jgi:hypothetical protein